ncbi:MAG: RNA polymerase sporulation sigma factor SigG [Christensenellaceae bacterium]|nr:RNA polymerase sporulation sigma factor SigG [Christensenellaceae bacterium]
MANKVVICGVNTSLLPKLKGKEIAELMVRLKAGDREARQLFIFSNMRLVLSVVQRFCMHKSNVDDVFQVGCVGLIKAMENFDEGFNVKFSTYAVPMIIGEIRRYLRDNTSVRVSRSLRDIAYKALQSRERLGANKTEEPRLEDIANDICEPLINVISALDAISDPVSLYDPVYNDGEDTMVMDQIGDSKNTSENLIEQVALQEAMGKLGEREKQILRLRYFLGKTQTEISDEVGISQAQVSRLEKNALSELKKSLV